MIHYTSNITYNNKHIRAHIDSVTDKDITSHLSSIGIALMIKLDIENRKLCPFLRNFQEYKIILAHGGLGNLYENHSKSQIMTKDEAAKKYDIIMACNAELWQAPEQSRVRAYAMGNPSGCMSAGNKRIGIETGFDAFRTMNSMDPIEDMKEHHFSIAGKKFSRILIKGDTNGDSLLKWDFSLGPTNVQILNFEDSSKEYQFQTE